MMPIICQIQVHNPSYGGGLLPPHRMHGRDKRSPVIASYFCACARETGCGDLLLIPSSRALLRGDLHFITIVWDLAVKPPCTVERPARSWGTMSPHPPRAVSTRP